MNKPTIFFSHSSQDSLTILPIKNRLSTITANVIDIFMSSDGQSIPFGHNWVHKIEEGLNSAQIMFVFVTPISVDSAWIYFEAGFAYSKNIEVIPVGIGVNIGQLRAPLNLLQGFDITSVDSLDNFITIINKKFDLKFKETFTASDYGTIFCSVTKLSDSLKVSDIFTSARYEMCSQYLDATDKTKVIRYDINKYFSDIKNYLDGHNISYASHAKSLLVAGIQIDITGEEEEPINGHPNQGHRLIIRLSTQNFSKSFTLLKTLVLKSGLRDDWMSMEFYFNKSYDCLHDEVMISSVISDSDGVFKYVSEHIGIYDYKDNFHFWIRDKNEWEFRKPLQYIVGISFKVMEVGADDVIGLVNEMQQQGLIFKIDQPRDSLV